MKFYIASSFSLIPKVVDVEEALEEAGHSITTKWWKRAYLVPFEGLVQTTELKKRYDSLAPTEFYLKPECEISYDLDFKGVKDAEALVFVADDAPRAYNGANVELGIALGDKKPCLSIGALQNSVLYHPVIKCSNIQELLSQIEHLTNRGKNDDPQA